jgi:hypothetical protein
MEKTAPRRRNPVMARFRRPSNEEYPLEVQIWTNGEKTPTMNRGGSYRQNVTAIGTSCCFIERFQPIGHVERNEPILKQGPLLPEGGMDER